MQLRKKFIPAGNTTYTQRGYTDNRPTGDEGDSGGKPVSKRPSGRDFPTIVVEDGFTQIGESLSEKARWWFNASRFAVAVVLLVPLDKRSQGKSLEKWKAEGRKEERPGQRQPGGILLRCPLRYKPSTSPDLNRSRMLTRDSDGV